MNRHEYLMTQAVSECCELAHRLTKAQHFGMDQIQSAVGDKPEQNPERKTNRERIIDEYTDLVATMEMLDISLGVVNGRAMDIKQARVRKYMTFARELGTLKED